MKTTQSVGPEGGQAAVGGELGGRVEVGSLTAPVKSVESKEQKCVWLLRQGARRGEDRARPSAGGPRVCSWAKSSARAARASPLLSLSSRTVFHSPCLQPQGSGRGGRKWLGRPGPVLTRPPGGGSDPTSPCGRWDEDRQMDRQTHREKERKQVGPGEGHLSLSPGRRSPDLQARSTSFSKSVCKTEAGRGEGLRASRQGCLRAGGKRPSRSCTSEGCVCTRACRLLSADGGHELRAARVLVCSRGPWWGAPRPRALACVRTRVCVYTRVHGGSFPARVA